MQQTNNRQTTDKQQTDNKQITTNKNDKNDKKNNIDIQQAENLDESYIKFNSWLMENAPIVSSLKTQMTEKQFLEIKRKYSSNQIINIINNIEKLYSNSKKI